MTWPGPRGRSAERRVCHMGVGHGQRGLVLGCAYHGRVGHRRRLGLFGAGADG